LTKYCDSCHTANKDRARYCHGCAGKFSGLRFDAAAFLPTLPDARAVGAMPPPRPAARALPRAPLP